MERPTGRRKKGSQVAPRRPQAPASPPSSAAPTAGLNLAEAPLLLALVAAPVFAGLHGNPLPPLLLGALAWLSLLLRLVLPGQPPLRVPRARWLTLLFPLLALLSIVTSANRGATLMQTVLYASYAALLWMAADVTARGGAGRLLAAILAGGLMAAGLGLAEYSEHVRAGDWGWRTFGRPSYLPFGGYTSQNFFAGYLVPCLLLTFGIAFHRPEAFKPGMWLLTLGMLVAALGAALMVTGSRGALLSLGAGLGVLLIVAALRRAFAQPEARWRFAALVLVLGLVGLSLSYVVRQRAAATTTTAGIPAELCPHSAKSEAGQSNEFRKLTWLATAQMGSRRPLLGWGAGSYETSFHRHAIAGFTRHAHQSYLQLFAEGGLAAPLVWLALVLASLVGLWRAARSPELAWVAGAAAALAANAAHNAVESLLFVPAVTLLAWALLGIGLGVPRAEAEPGTAPSAAPQRRCVPCIAAVALGLLVTGWHAAGRALVNEGRDLLVGDPFSSAPQSSNPTAALEALGTAQAMLPLDHEVADLQRRAHSHPLLGQWRQATDAARRALELAPERPSSYYFLGRLREDALGEPLVAESQYAAGLEKVPSDVTLLDALAGLQERLGRPKDALDNYRKIWAVEQSPAERVRAVQDVRDYRFARARMKLAEAAAAAGDAAAAAEHRKTAACLLAERRRLYQINPQIFQILGLSDPRTEDRLRVEESELWRGVAKAYRQQQQVSLATLADEQARQAAESPAAVR